jgi:CheY-like chemotaxis protein
MAKRILLVDDDIDDQMIVRSAIQMLDPSHDCTFANNGKEAIEFLEGIFAFDIVILDLNMPLMNGFDTLKAIRASAILKDLPVVVISTSGFKYDIERCIRYGASRYIIKPDTFPALMNELKNVLEL